MREAIGPAQVLGRRWGERSQRVDPGDARLVEVVRPVGTEDDGAVLLGANEQPADVRVLAQRRQELWVAILDLLEREAPWHLHQIDEAEVPGPEHDDAVLGDR